MATVTETTKVKVFFDYILVNEDGDPGTSDGVGEFYWDFEINGTSVVTRPKDEAIKGGKGDKIQIDKPVSVALGPDEKLTLGGYLYEKDQFTSGDDERGRLDKIHHPEDRWDSGAHSTSLRDRKLDCTLYYTITVG